MSEEKKQRLKRVLKKLSWGKKSLDRIMNKIVFSLWFNYMHNNTNNNNNNNNSNNNNK